MTVRLKAALLALVVSSGSVAAQAPGAPAYEVVSIRPHDPTDPVSVSSRQGDVNTYRGFSLYMLIQVAYPDANDAKRIAGDAAWMREQRLDVRAKGGPADAAAEQAMLRRLLADRFGLRTHTETREMDVYVARLARADGKLGSGLTPSLPECAAARAARSSLPEKCVTVPQPGALTLSKTTVPTLLGVVRQLGGYDRPLLDRTGLTGTYEVSIRYQSTDATGVNTTGTTLFTAMQDQLGLKVESARAPVDVLVIDAAHPPTPD